MGAAGQSGTAPPAGWVDPPRRSIPAPPAASVRPPESPRPPEAAKAPDLAKAPEAAKPAEAAKPVEVATPAEADKAAEGPREVRIIPPAGAPERPVAPVEAARTPPAAVAVPAPPREPDRGRPPQPAPETREAAAQRFVGEYLAQWSGPNDAMLDAMPALYAPRVEFHGREVGLRSILREKERFARRWPSRSYVLRKDGQSTICDASRDLCIVRGMFDFSVVNERRRRQAQGVSNLEIIVDFSGGKPLIAAETSRQLSRAEARRAQASAARAGPPGTENE